MLTVVWPGEAHVAARSANDFVPEFSVQEFRQLFAADIPGEPHTASVSSFTRCNRISSTWQLVLFEVATNGVPHGLPQLVHALGLRMNGVAGRFRLVSAVKRLLDQKDGLAFNHP